MNIQWKMERPFRGLFKKAIWYRVLLWMRPALSWASAFSNKPWLIDAGGSLPRARALSCGGETVAHTFPLQWNGAHTHTQGRDQLAKRTLSPSPQHSHPFKQRVKRNSAGPIMRPPFFKSARIYLKANLVKIHPYRSCKCITRTLQGDPSQHI